MMYYRISKNENNLFFGKKNRPGVGSDLKYSSKKRITKALISLRESAGWSAPLLFANPEDRFFLAEARLTVLASACDFGTYRISPADLSNGVRCLHLHPFVVYTNGEGSSLIKPYDMFNSMYSKK